MEIIAELEEAPRGLYCGRLDIWATNGESQFSIATNDGRWNSSLSCRAGIVADSDPIQYEETCTKLGIRMALERRSDRVLHSG
jgi:anthranilate/para-aminobenzoate synthase component I